MKKLIMVFSAISFFSYSQNDLYSQAMDDFKNGDYGKALVYFQQQIKKTGLLQDAGYNLAVCYYKLGRWQEANQIFQQIYQQNSNDWQVLYSLAVTEKKTGNTVKASEYFLAVALQTDNLTLAEQAVEQYLMLNPHLRNDLKHRAVLLGDISLQYGMDDHVTEYSQDSGLTKKHDMFTDLYAGLSWYSDTDLSEAWMIEAMMYITEYQETDTYDYELFALTAGKYLTLTSTRFFMGIDLRYNALVFEPYLAHADINLAMTSPFGEHYSLDVHYRYRHIVPLAKTFTDERGQSHRLILMISYQQGEVGSLHVDYRYLQDDLEGKRSGGDVFNFSGDHHSFNASGIMTFSHWQFGLNASYRYTGYRNTFMGNGGIQQQRSDNRVIVGSDLVWLLTPEISLSMNYSFSKNDSTLEEYRYDRNILTAGIRWKLDSCCFSGLF